MYFGVDYHPEHWVYPYAGSPENPEARWQRDIELMVEAEHALAASREMIRGGAAHRAEADDDDVVAGGHESA